MSSTFGKTLVVVAGTAVLLSPALPASAAHESNNKAQLVGEATGNATVNYIAGRDSEQWTGNVRVRGLEAGDYTYVLVSPTGDDTAEVCSFTADGRGSDGCSNSSFETGGFLTAEVRDEDGDVVSTGTFERRGGNREKG